MPTNDAQSCVCKVSRFKPGEVGSLYVRQSNTGAADLYRLFGFSVLGRHKGYYAGGEDALLMEAPLPLRLPGDRGEGPPEQG